jgi:geranylgeranyl diphosphate synthase type 3
MHKIFINKLCNILINFTFTDILRQRTRDVEVKRYCVSLLEKSGSFQYTRQILDALDIEARTEAGKFGPNPIMTNLLDELLSWKTTAD